MSTVAENQTPALQAKHKTTPIAGSLASVPGYPSKLVIYQLAASKYWWVRYYANGKILRRSTKCEDKKSALSFAETFYEDLIVRQRQGLTVSKRGSVESCATALIKSQASQLLRGEITQITADNTKYRLFKMILPFFRAYDAASVTYDVLEQFLNQLSKAKPKLSTVTINSYMKLVRRVLAEGMRKSILTHLPEFPRVRTTEHPRGYFTVQEYRKLWARARALRGKVYELRKVQSRSGKGETTHYVLKGRSDAGRLIRRVEFSEDLYQLIVFMTNSFIRPTDIKFLQHKHVEVVRNDNVYLRMRLPVTKNHKDPIVTMPKAVEVYERLRVYHTKISGKKTANDYVFSPQYLKRDYALKQLQRQFDVLLHLTGLREGGRGEDRSLYSLRHTCIMFRLMYGEKMDLLTLARNARTTPDMIDRYYAAQLKGEDNVDMLQSRRKRKSSKQA
jgi:hypothetical protein